MTTVILGVLLCLSTSLQAASNGQNKIDLTTGTPQNKEAMVFSKNQISVKAGSRVTLQFKNGSASKGMLHNLVIAYPQQGQALLDASIKAGPEKDWVSDSLPVLVKTKLLDLGESETLEFTAPNAPGEYPYYCTFPGHSATMRGVLKVVK